VVGESRRALSARRVSTISWGQSHRLPARELLRRIQCVEKVGVELIATTKRARNAPEAVCLVADPGRKRAAAEFFDTLPTSRHSGQYLRRDCHPSSSVSARLVKK
jgi:hypothetical protein